jgi:hypothetical protein
MGGANHIHSKNYVRGGATDIYIKLIHEFAAVRSLAEARYFAFISLIRIKQVVIPTNHTRFD